MSDAKTTEPAPARPSATVMLIRDGDAGLEVFMVARKRPMDGAMGALVFPGGKVDDEDRLPGWSRFDLPTRRPERPYWIAAIRETFEEAGVLLARPTDATTALLASGDAIRIADTSRNRLLDRGVRFYDILHENGLLPALDRMVPFAHWVTPIDLPKRFDTHFFLVAAPADQSPSPDGREMADSLWIRPETLLAETVEGKRTLVPATRFNLELLSESRTVGAALDAARRRPVVTVLPRKVQTPDGPRMLIPANAGYRTNEFRSSRG